MRSAERCGPYTADPARERGRRIPPRTESRTAGRQVRALGLRLPDVPTDRLAERLGARDGVALVDDRAADERQLREDAL